MRHVRCLDEAETVFACFENFAVRHTFSRVHRCEIVDAHDFADETANRCRLRCDLLPLVDATALVRFEMAEPDPFQCRRIDQSGDRVF